MTPANFIFITVIIEVINQGSPELANHLVTQVYIARINK